MDHFASVSFLVLVLGFSCLQLSFIPLVLGPLIVKTGSLKSESLKSESPGTLSPGWALAVMGVSAAVGIGAATAYLSTGYEPWLWAAVPGCTDPAPWSLQPRRLPPAPAHDGGRVKRPLRSRSTPRDLVNRFRRRHCRETIFLAARSRFWPVATSAGNKARSASRTAINDGVGHVGHHHPDLSRILHSAAAGDAEIEPMLAEKFLLLLETLREPELISDGAPRVVSSSPHVPVTLPRRR